MGSGFQLLYACTSVGISVGRGQETVKRPTARWGERNFKGRGQGGNRTHGYSGERGILGVEGNGGQPGQNQPKLNKYEKKSSKHVIL